MRIVQVRYKVKPERVDEHVALIRAVFAELSATAPDGIHYAAYREADGLRFVHIARVTAPENPLNAIAAFKAFTETVKERCDEPPVTTELAEIGAYLPTRM
jgi:hypothetical protein